MKLIIAAAALIVSAGIAIAYQPTGNQDALPSAQPSEQRRPMGNPGQMGEQLIQGLLATPGCLGADAAQTRSGKNVIFAWFENKAAAMAWYNSPTHTFMRKAFTDPTGEEYKAMEHVPDDVPVLTIASLKMSDKPLPGLRIPVSEISIELYTPLPGGIRYNGGFSPEKLDVPHRRDFKAPEPETKPDSDAQQPADAKPAGN